MNSRCTPAAGVSVSLKTSLSLDGGENLLRAIGYLLNSIAKSSRGGFLISPNAAQETDMTWAYYIAIRFNNSIQIFLMGSL